MIFFPAVEIAQGALRFTGQWRISSSSKGPPISRIRFEKYQQLIWFLKMVHFKSAKDKEEEKRTIRFRESSKSITKYLEEERIRYSCSWYDYDEDRFYYSHVCMGDTSVVLPRMEPVRHVRLPDPSCSYNACIIDLIY